MAASRSTPGLDWQAVDVPFGGGLDGKAQRFLTEAPSFPVLENFRHVLAGGLQKRPSFRALGSVPAVARRAARYEDQPTIITDAGIFQYSEKAGGVWREALNPGPSPALLVESQRVLRSDEGADQVYGAAIDDVACFAWSNYENGKVWALLVEVETGVAVAGPIELPLTTRNSLATDASRSDLQLVACDDDTFIVVGRNTGNDIVGVPITSAGALGSAVVLRGSVASSEGTVLAHGSQQSSFFFVTYNTSTATFVLRVSIANGVITTVAPAQSTPADDRAQARCVFHSPLNGRLYLACQADPDGLGPSPSVGGMNPGDGLVYSTTDDLNSGPVTSASNRFFDASSTSVTPVPALVERVTLVQRGTNLLLAWEGSAALTPGIGEGPVDVDTQEDTFTAPPGETSFRSWGLNWVQLVSSGAVNSVLRTISNVRLHAHGFSNAQNRVFLPLLAVAGQEYALLFEPLADQADYPLGRLTGTYQADVAAIPSFARGADGNAARLSPRLSWTYPSRLGSLRYVAGHLVRELDLIANPDFIDPIGLAGGTEIFSARGTYYRPPDTVGVGNANDLFVTGAGLAGAFDGRIWAELAMPPPRVVALLPVDTSSTSVTRTGNVSYRFVWRWRDAGGNLRRSAPTQLNVNLGDNTQADVRRYIVSAPPPTHWQTFEALTELHLEVYQSPPPSPSSRDTAVPVVPVAGNYGRLHIVRWVDIIDSSQTWQSVARVLAVDNQALGIGAGGTPGEDPLSIDSTAVSLYTNGATVDALAAEIGPNPADLATAADRVWVLDAENRRDFWFSSPIVDGAAPILNGNLKVRLPGEAGGGTAIGTLDDAIILFCRRSIYEVTGDGPDRFGGGNSFTLRRVSGEAGCTVPASVVETDAGLFFVGEQGMYLLTPGRTLEHVGYPTGLSFLAEQIVSATVFSEDKQVVWNTQDGDVLVYDYEHEAWTRYTTALPVAGAGTIRGTTPLYVAASGTVFQEQQAESIAVGAVFETSWLRFAGNQGFQRVRRVYLLGRVDYDAVADTGSAGAGRVRVDVMRDYKSPVVYTREYDFNALRLDTREGIDPLQLRMRLPSRFQKSQALKLRVTYLASVADVGLEWSGLTLELGLRRGGFRRPHTAEATA